MTDVATSDVKAQTDAAFAAWRSALPTPHAMRRLFETDDVHRAMALVRAWEAAQMAQAVDWPASRRLHIALCGFGTLHYAAQPVAWAVLADGAVPKVTLGGYNQFFQDLTSADSPVLGSDVQVIWVWADLMDLLPGRLVGQPAELISTAGLQAVDEAVDHLVAALRSARERSRAMLLVNDFVPLRRSPLGISDAHGPIGFDGVYARANQRLREQVAALGSVYLFPLGQHLRRTGLVQALDVRLQLMADCRFAPNFLFQLACGLRPFLRAHRGLTRKVLVLDLDNTLWGGIVGEDGWAGVRIGDDPVGRAYLRFQQAVLQLYHRGVILAINSKNNPDDAREVFERREEMVLRLEHFAAVRMNWDDKASNCQAIARELNVGLDSLVFWDDNPVERAYVRETLEEVWVIEPPADPARWADCLAEVTLFDALYLTQEDAERSRMYAQDRLRREAADRTPDVGAFLKSLQLKVTCTPARDEHIPRLVSLLARTNQFNLTTRRHSEQAIRAWVADPNWSVLGFATEDRFGSYGLVGLALLERSAGAARLDSLLLSCRALGKQIEHAMLAAVADQTRRWGLSRIEATLVFTSKNHPIRNFLPECGFTRTRQTEESCDYVLDLNQRELPMPGHVAFTRIE